MTTNFQKNAGNVASYASATGLGGSFLDTAASTASISEWASKSWSPSALANNDGEIVGELEVAPPAGFTFITAPQDISYSQNSDVKTVSMFGTNEPPVTVGQTNMKKLQLGNAMMEGFIVGKSVQKPIDELFALMNVELRNGFVNVPVYTVLANQKTYSAREGGWIIGSVTVKEELRDTKGSLTRAIVDVELQEVGKYQINSGVDQASTPEAPPKTPGGAVNQAASQAANIASSSKTVPA